MQPNTKPGYRKLTTVVTKLTQSKNTLVAPQNVIENYISAFLFPRHYTRIYCRTSE